MMLGIGDPCLVRRHPGAHEERGEVVGRTFCARPAYDVRTSTGDLLVNVNLVEFDEAAMKLIREAEGLRENRRSDGSLIKKGMSK